ncbi:RNA ligase [Halapricum hydrolyticum]|uniref:RNA ligase n=1 Tax=Halapricum hydrolyticum TaxID=2979991 RepID=A0AAE3IDH7_9EURY|nr:RNA ligase [Halapricum hydrolyticum]MCU4718717.1 RNA ligase [Halapricum hydrolyticum]MCU4727704.1 RNA ligase [Halapricum hydrolyticum]
MDRDVWHERLETSADSPSELFEHLQTRTDQGLEYYYLPDARHGLERGTVLVETTGAVVRGYPSVPRVLVLDPGVRNYFEGDRITIEEKLNGFNVRIADVDGTTAFTRSGYVCPYTTERARELLDPGEFFADHPEKMLCAELVGPENPYTVHDYDGVETNAFRVFDVRDRRTGRPLAPERRRKLCAEYGFEQPQTFGWHDTDEAAGAVRDAIETLDAEGREGVVMKSEDGQSLLKYTTEATHHAELAYAFSLPFEYGRDFLFSRLLREAFQTVEFEESPERRRERAHDLGESILLPMAGAIEAVADGETVGERHTVRGDPETVNALLEHLREFQLTIDVESDRRLDGERVVTFTKVSASTNDRIEHYLDGGIVDE